MRISSDFVRLSRSLAVHSLDRLRWLGKGLAVALGEPFFRLLGMREKGDEFDLSRVKRVLVIRLDEIGDVVMSTPLFRELRRAVPAAWITLVVKPGVYNLVELCPYVNEVLTFHCHCKAGRSLEGLRGNWRALRLAAAHLWRRRFELAINPRWDADYCHAAVIAYLSGARWRIGYSEDVIDHKRRLNRGLNRLYTHVLDDDTHEHEVQRDLNVVRFLGGTVQQDRLELWIGDGDAAFARATFKQYGIDTTELVVGFGPSGGASPLKQWPVCNFIQLGRWLETTFRARIVVLGAPGEEALGWDIERGLSPSAVNLVGKTTLRQAAAVLRCCDLYVGNDSGPMHIAAAMGVPVVALFGSSCPHRFGVRGNGHRVLWASFPCSPCCRAGHLDRCRRCVFDRPYCMSDITVAHVKGAILDQLLLTGQTIPFLHDACSDRHAATAEGAVALFLQKQGIVSL